MINSILGVFCIAWFIMLWFAVFNKYLSVWACDSLGWHLEPERQGYDGCSYGGKCPRCGKDVLQDSQGNWFAIEEL